MVTRLFSFLLGADAPASPWASVEDASPRTARIAQLGHEIARRSAASRSAGYVAGDPVAVFDKAFVREE